ncbi:MAG: lysine--tRNA ligase [Gammaproteobacteria bacterium]|nr:lysine--tRNA ligase [Gammaproteobacteria bacterium]
MKNKSINSENEQIAQRRAKLVELRDRAVAYPNDFRRDALAGALHAHYDELSTEELEVAKRRACVAGRIMSRRIQGRVSFVHLQDMSGQLQLFVQRDALPDTVYNEEFKKWDIGDIVGATGVLFKTRTGELTLKVDEIRLLVKSLRPLPEKFHGVTDPEIRYRQRYLDLIMNEPTRRTFRMRSQIVNFMRRFLIERDFLEVETPMMQAIPGGAVARPFQTYHHALGMDLFLRIAPELYLKRLVVGGFERVFEINRNFRNEGISTQHNPEFTMLEFYQAYSEYSDLMDLTETMLREMAVEVLGTPLLEYQDERFDLSKPFARFSVDEAILKFNPDMSAADLADRGLLAARAAVLDLPVKDTYGIGKLKIEIFEKTVEQRLREPTYITAYPVEVSPLSRTSDHDPEVADRFELFIAGREIANGFSELNDPEDQAERFRRQVAEKEAGDLEAMHFDADYVRALEHGLPPTAGEGIGVDRLVMLFTDSASIRDVLLFPHLRPEA